MEKDKKLTKIKDILVYIASMDINSSCKEISDIRVIIISTTEVLLSSKLLL